MTPPVFAHGHLRLYLLSLLAERPKHGYELIQALSDRFGGTYVPSAGTIYPRLAKLEEEGLVSKESDGRKTVYSITDAGRAELAERERELDGIEDEVTRLGAPPRQRGAPLGQRRDEDAASRSGCRGTGCAHRGARRRPNRARRTRRTEGSDDPRVQARMALRDAEAAINDFRQQVRSELRAQVVARRASTPRSSALITSGLSALRRDITAALRP